MKLISEEIEYKLQYQEANPFTPIAARLVLEEALKYQFSALADGLLADWLLKGGHFSNIYWWQHYLTKLGSSRTYFPDFNDANFLAFRSRFINNTIMRRVPRITLTDLNDVQIRIYGKSVNLWQDLDINKQLVVLGSDYRLVLVDCRSLATNHLLLLLGKEPTAQVEGGFIFGRVGTVSSCLVAPVFEFWNEVATSPYIPANAKGFTYDDENRIVIRPSVIMMEVQSGHDLHSKESFELEKKETQDFEALFAKNRMGTWIHEATHVVSVFRPPDSGLKYRRSFWLQDTRFDICRYTQVPRSIEEIHGVFELNFLMDMSWVDNKELRSVPTLDNILAKMVKEGLIIITPENKVFCPLYKEGQRWRIP